jgi:small multidrug resistance family-3 protein
MLLMGYICSDGNDMGLIIDKNRPDRFEIVGGAVVLLGALVIFYAPRQ